MSEFNGNGYENGNDLSGNGHEDIKKPTVNVQGALQKAPMKMERFFSFEGRDPLEFDIKGEQIKWEKTEVSINDDTGKVIYTQPNVEKPSFWSDLATKVVASKYFWGNLQKGERENSVKQLISRVADFIGRKGLQLGYFDERDSKILRDEIAAITLNQLCVFNSPVWFNAGIQKYSPVAGGVSPYKWDSNLGKVVVTEKNEDQPQCSACFILSVGDSMEEIMELQRAEAMLFKGGSGAGSNRSSLRSSKERLTGGGWSSGPLSFMKGYDAYAGAIKSGGKTRRAAKMEILNVSHPDIMDFVEAKQKEEKKAWALIEAGFGGGLNGEVYQSIFFQNSNMSVRVTDEFMQAAREGKEWQTKYVTTGEVCETLDAKDVLRKIAEGTWICGDPGIQNDSIINKYHTCKNSGRINASNPCSEYMFLDDTACNLASINLMKFRTPEGGFDVEKFKKVVRYFITAMEIIVDGASYPTDRITERSHIFRTLGLGYANLGALLMSLGLPYDSNEGRAVAAAITAIMCGEAYKTSAELARMMGPFPGYEENREPMLEVIRMQREHVKDINVEAMPANLRDLVNVAWDSWSDALEIGEKHGFRNAQTTVLAPTGTIAFMMDCDTTGIEPDIALVKYKVLAGGGMLKIVNRSVKLALERLGYDDSQIKEVVDYIDENDTIEGAPHIRDEHLSIFDCAFKPAKGERSIHWKGHVDMMSVTQPFLSGAISKTVNLSEKSTVEDIMDAYIYAWERGLKAVAIYRENSKRSQPLNTKQTKGEMWEKEGGKVVIKSERKKLPQTRRSIIHKFEIAGHEGYLTVGLYDDGKPGEIFVSMHKQGSTIRGLMDAWATSVSLNLQYGVSVNDLFGKFRHQRFEPAGFVKNLGGGSIDEKIKKINTASSIVDYVSQFMLNNFGEGTGKIKTDLATVDEIYSEEEQAELTEFGNEGLTCPICGGPAKRIGNCEVKCESCMNVSRSGCGQ